MTSGSTCTRLKDSKYYSFYKKNTIFLLVSEQTLSSRNTKATNFSDKYDKCRRNLAHKELLYLYFALFLSSSRAMKLF